MQREIPIVSAAQPLEFLHERLIERCRNEHDAILLCWSHRRVKGMSQALAAATLGIPNSHMSNILAGKKYPPYGFRTAFQMLCGNWALRQYADKVEGFRTVVEAPIERENRLLREQLAEMQRAA